MAKRVSESNNKKKNNKPVLFKLLTGANGRSLYLGKVENKGDFKGRKLILIVGSEWDSEEFAFKRTEIRGFLDPSIESVPIEIGDTVVISYAPAKDLNTPGIIEEVVKAGQCTTAYTEHDGKQYRKVVIYGKVKKTAWNQSHNVFTVSFMDLRDIEGNDYGLESHWTSDGEEYMAFWTNVSFFGEANSEIKNRYPADRAEKDIHTGDTVVIMTQYKESVDHISGKTYINHNANKYMVIDSAEQNNASHNNNEQTTPAPQQNQMGQQMQNNVQTAPQNVAPVSAPQQSQPGTSMQPTQCAAPAPQPNMQPQPEASFFISNNVAAPTMNNDTVPDDELPF